MCHLADTKLADRSALELAKVIQKHPKLRDLDISNNLFIMDDVEKLANAFKESSIDLLNLRGNIISAEEIAAFEHLLIAVATMSKRKFIF